MKNDEVSLPEGETGSKFFFRVLKEAAQTFSIAGLPRDSKTFKSGYGDALARFEAARIASPDRVKVARHLVAALRSSVRFAGLPLTEALKTPVAAPKLETHALQNKGCSLPITQAQIDRLHADHHMSNAAHRALSWMVARGALDLSKERFVILGAGAELSPARLLLEAGATVLWIDVKAPDVSTLRGGTVVFNPAGDDLLRNPMGALASIRAFCKDAPAHFDLLAYAPGASRELRIAATMNLMLEALDPKMVQSVAMLISPTSPGEMQAEDIALAGAREDDAPLWMRGLALARALPAPGSYGGDRGRVARSIVGLQGQAYQAAQYIAKILSAEVLAADGLNGKAITVSANVAGITNTRSLSHPLFQVAFVGAPSFGVNIFVPDITRALSSVLMVHDVINPDAPGAADKFYDANDEKARALRSQQIHGGVYNLPWQFDACVRVAALLGASRKPKLLLRRSA